MFFITSINHNLRENYVYVILQEVNKEVMKNKVLVIYREKTADFKSKPLRVKSIRVSEEDAEFLDSLPNASEFLRKAINEEKRKQLALNSKGLPLEMVHEIAEAFVECEIRWMQKDDVNLHRQNESLSNPDYST